MLVWRRVELDRRGKPGAAHAADAGVVHAGEQVLAGGGFPVERREERRRGRLVLGHVENHRVGPAAGGAHPLFDGRDRAGDRRVHGHGDEAVALADELSLDDGVAFLDEAFRRRAEVLAHGDDELLGKGHRLDRLGGREVLVVLRVHAAVELKR